MLPGLGQDVVQAGRGFLALRAIQDDRGADFMPGAEDRQYLAVQVDPDPGRAGANARVVPAEIAIFEAFVDLEQRLDRTVEFTAADGLLQLCRGEVVAPRKLGLGRDRRCLGMPRCIGCG